MPRKPRIDEPGLIYHVIARGIERRQIFRDDGDRHDFLERINTLINDTSTQICAFALLPNHFHLLLRRSETSVATFMQRLLTGYAIHFNKKYDRVGHLFQNRYKSILCQNDRHFLELVRYIHLNPIRAGLVSSMEELDRFSFSGHGAVLGRSGRGWLNTSMVLVHFGSCESEARRAYLDFVMGGLNQEYEPDPGEKRVEISRDYREAAFRDKPEFGNAISQPETATDYICLFNEICSSFSISQTELLSSTRRRRVAEARALLAFRMSKEMGLSGSEIGRRLLVTRSAASKMIGKGEKLYSSTK